MMTDGSANKGKNNPRHRATHVVTLEVVSSRDGPGACGLLFRPRRVPTKQTSPLGPLAADFVLVLVVWAIESRVHLIWIRQLRMSRTVPAEAKR